MHFLNYTNQIKSFIESTISLIQYFYLIIPKMNDDQIYNFDSQISQNFNNKSALVISNSSFSQEETNINMSKLSSINQFSSSKIIQELQNSEFMSNLLKQLSEQSKISQCEKFLNQQNTQRSKILLNCYLMNESELRQSNLKFSQISAFNANLPDSSNLKDSQFSKLEISVIQKSNPLQLSTSSRQNQSEPDTVKIILSKLEESTKKNELMQKVEKNQQQLLKLKFQLFQLNNKEIFKQVRKYAKQSKVEKKKSESVNFLKNMKKKLQAGMNHPIS